MCTEVAPSTYYKELKHQPSKRELENEQIDQESCEPTPTTRTVTVRAKSIIDSSLIDEEKALIDQSKGIKNGCLSLAFIPSS